jgi:hypothetical protein
MQTLYLEQIARVLKRMTADGKLLSAYEGQGRYVSTTYRLAK